eukprot:TRINITY_DN2773_c0_g1_i2.p1 TRINITY_DN2773_c0_g1~~TRINITY_DN2773_c0_g1_i2.p1  ORF type:complete len:205 (+),score=96.35 TRINITY_DN2773_c0_g1_i2:97-711(+)
MLLESQRKVLRNSASGGAKASTPAKVKDGKKKSTGKSTSSSSSSSSRSGDNKALLKEEKNLKRMIGVMQSEMEEWKQLEEAFDESALRASISGGDGQVDVQERSEDGLPSGVLNSYQMDLLRGQCNNLLSDQLKSTLQTMTLSTDTMMTIVNSMAQSNKDTQSVMAELVAHYQLQSKTKAKGGSGRPRTNASKLIRGITKAGKK